MNRKYQHAECRECSESFVSGSSKSKWCNTCLDYYGRHQVEYLWRKYGLTYSELEKLYNEVDGCCEICGTYKSMPQRFKGRNKGQPQDVLNIDHCHTTGRVRGLLCWECNTSIGKLGDTYKQKEK